MEAISAKTDVECIKKNPNNTPPSPKKPQNNKPRTKKETKTMLLNGLLDEILSAVLQSLVVGVGVTRTGCASSSSSPRHRATELKSNQTELFEAVWLIHEVHQTAPQKRPTQKLHTASSQCNLQPWSTKESDTVISESQAYLRESQMQLWHACSQLLMAGAA